MLVQVYPTLEPDAFGWEGTVTLKIPHLLKAVFSKGNVTPLPTD